MYLFASLWFWKLPEPRAGLFISLPDPPCKAQLSGPICQPGTGWDRATDQRVDIWDNGLTGRLQCMRWGWIAKESAKNKSIHKHPQTHTPELYGREEMEILADFAKGGGAKVSSLKTLLESSIAPGLLDWLVELPRMLQLFFSSCKVIWWKINPTLI